MSFVYLVVEGVSGPCKIGLAESVSSRCSTLQTGNPRQLEVHDYVPHSNAALLEQALHHHFRDFHVRGEWFDITPDHAKCAMKALAAKDADVLKRAINGASPPNAVPRGGYRHGQRKPMLKPSTEPRKEYLKLKARERRAATKLGLSVGDYRKQQEGK